MDHLLSVFVRIHNLLLAPRSEEGQTLAEYGLLITIISVAVVLLAVITFRGALVGAWNSASDCLNAVTC